MDLKQELKKWQQTKKDTYLRYKRDMYKIDQKIASINNLLIDQNGELEIKKEVGIDGE